MTDWILLGAEALKNCKTYRDLDKEHIRGGPKVKYSKSDEVIEALDDEFIDTSKYITNQDELDAHDEYTGNLIEAHLKSCDVPSCKALYTARVEVEVYKV